MKNFINIKDIPEKDLKKIIVDAKRRKKKRKKLNNLDVDKGVPLKGKFLIQMFEKSSLRTRLSFYLAIRQLGGGALDLRTDELHLSKGGESIHDTAKIISNYGDIFILRTDSDKKLLEFKKFLNIPVINALSPSSHPTQILSDIFTIEEIKKKSINKLNICWIGDGNNVLNSLIEASVKFSFNLKIGSPKKYEPSKSLINWAKKNKSKIKIFNDAKKAILNSDIVFADKFIGVYDKSNKKKKIKDFKNFQVNSELMRYANNKAIFLHCLPASRGQEVSAKVIDGKQSKVWQQALNRVHVQKSILLYCLEKLR
jgi:ornithine carbamoyltransferase